VTRLEKPLKREVAVNGASYVVTLSPEGLAVVPKGRRKGYRLSWESLVGGDAALATALNASLVSDARSRSARGDGAAGRRR
jgi:hypothetical protein